jgi:putative tricarboxylic transport membrane protein
VLGAFLLIVLHALTVSVLGFYVSTMIFVPLIAYLFGYRSVIGLAIATVIVVAAIAMIFSIAMGQDFPRGLLGLR